jgi:hypothetical protein
MALLFLKKPIYNILPVLIPRLEDGDRSFFFFFFSVCFDTRFSLMCEAYYEEPGQQAIVAGFPQCSFSAENEG